MFTKVHKRDTADIIAAQIMQLIRDGTLKPGSKLPTESDLIKQFGVGRSSVREAKRVLTAKGIIESAAGRGTLVRELGPDVLDGDLLQALLARETLVELQEVRDLLDS